MTARQPRQLFRDSAANLDLYTGPAGEPMWDLTNSRLRVNNAVTAGGIIIPNMSDLAAYLPKAGGTMTGKIVLDGDPTLALHPASKQYVDGVAAGSPSPNRLGNPAFAINQRRAATNADDTYCLDRWYVLTQTGTIAVTQLTDPEAGYPTGVRLTQSQASAQRIGLAQITESADIRDLRSAAVALAARIRCSASQAIRMAILEWTGTADSVTSDVVNSWTSTNYTPNNFFISTVNVIAVGANTPAANTWTDMTPITASFGASLNNAIVVVWTEGTLAQNATLDLDKVVLSAGGTPANLVRRMFVEELSLSQRFYEKTFAYNTTPAQNIGPNSGDLRWPNTLTGNSGTQYFMYWTFKVRKRGAPTVTAYNPEAANALARFYAQAADSAVATTFSPNEYGVRFSFQTPASGSPSVGDAMTQHATADSEL